MKQQIEVMMPRGKHHLSVWIAEETYRELKGLTQKLGISERRLGEFVGGILGREVRNIREQGISEDISLDGMIKKEVRPSMDGKLNDLLVCIAGRADKMGTIETADIESCLAAEGHVHHETINMRTKILVARNYISQIDREPAGKPTFFRVNFDSLPHDLHLTQKVPSLPAELPPSAVPFQELKQLTGKQLKERIKKRYHAMIGTDQTGNLIIIDDTMIPPKELDEITKEIKEQGFELVDDDEKKEISLRASRNLELYVVFQRKEREP